MPRLTTDDKVRLIVTNLASIWNGGTTVLERLVSAAPGAASPWAAYRALGPEQVKALFSRGRARDDLNAAVAALSAYLEQETWFDRRSATDEELSALHGHPIAYFCAEFALADWLPIYSGGLGVLAGDVLKEASDMGLPFVGIGLFYRHGFFSQALSDQAQVEHYTTLDPADLPMQRVRDASGAEVVVEVPVADRRVYAAVWQIRVGRTALYLLDTDIPENTRQEDRGITGYLYGGDAETRIQQELILGLGGVRVLQALGIDPSVYSMNEGHAAFLGIELLSQSLSGTDFGAALSQVRDRVVYTNHTVVPAGNDIFTAALVRRYLAAYAAEGGMGVERLVELGATGADQFSMAILAFHLSGKANAVSQIHADAIRAQWPGYPVESVTNGVHVPTWLGGETAALLDRYVPEWRKDGPDWAALYSIPAGELWAAHVRQRQALVDTLAAAFPETELDRDALTIVWARRFAEYKRAGLIASDIERLARIMSQPDRPVQLVVSGKAHPRDDVGKGIMRQFITALKGHPAISPHVVFVPDYSLALAQHLTAGADIWLNTPRKPLEASGTSGMKASDNGALQLTVRDGWAAEVDWWDVGWGIEGTDDRTDADLLYHFLEESIVPTFYGRVGGVPEKWTSMMKNTMIITLSRYSTRRMVMEYVSKLYLPLVKAQRSRALAAV